MFARGLIDMERTAYVGLENLLERTFGGDPAQVHDGIHFVGKRQDPGLVRQVAADHLFMLASGWRHLADIGGAYDMGVRLQRFAQDLPKPAGGAGQQQAVEGFAGSGGGRCRHGRYLWLIFCHMTKPGNPGGFPAVGHYMKLYWIPRRQRAWRSSV
ncbi:hypothetical protein D3C81_1728140 [compost metagenome]